MLLTAEQFKKAAEKLQREQNTPEARRKHLQEIGYLDKNGKPRDMVTRPQCGA